MFFAVPSDGIGVWVTPGGGLEADESYEDGAQRELWKETGLSDVVLSHCVWQRTHRFSIHGQYYEQQERFFVCRIGAHDIGEHVNVDETERDEITDHRRWTADEIEASADEFAPRALAALLRPILRGELPGAPIIVGV
jgi:8-oxo-dGTP pyrophosphatase MutT (NUDIX family)